MNDPLLLHVGSRIRLYRKNCGMSLSDLAERVHKSKASISKYEAGTVGVDIGTLFEIAQALNITPSQLIDYSVPRKASTQSPNARFRQYDKNYLYHMSHKKVYCSILETYPGKEMGQTGATLFYKVDNQENLEKCFCIYNGEMYCHDMLLSFILRNYHNDVENILMNFSIPMHYADSLTGMISGIGTSIFAPTAHKIILSKEPLQVDDKLRSELTISAEAFKEMKRDNMLFIPW